MAGLAASADQMTVELREAETQDQAQRQQVQAHQDELQALIRQLEQWQAQVKTDKAEHFEQVRQVGRLQNDTTSFKAQLDGLSKDRERRQQRIAQMAESLASVDLELQELTQADETLQARQTATRQNLFDQRQERERLRQVSEETTSALSDLRARRSGLASRMEVLEGLERSHEGLGTGVREVLDLIASADSGPWGTVLGMVADLLTVRREYAPSSTWSWANEPSVSWSGIRSSYTTLCASAASRSPAGSVSSL